MTRLPTTPAWRTGLAGLVALLALSAPVAADDGGERAARVPPMPAYRQECASCHVAYPPGLLPAASWRRLMDGLPRHFGTDASVDEPTLKALSDWLQAHAARRPSRDAAPPPQDRITRSAWFLREHRELRPATWALPAVKSAANCAACHPRADQGDFDEHQLRIPR